MGAPRVAFATLGCKVNQYDTQALQELFQREGFQVVGFHEPADVYVVNTCAVTGEGERQSRQVVRRAVRRAAGRAAVVVTGCLAQIRAQELQALPGVTAVVGTHGRARVVEAALRWLGRRGEPWPSTPAGEGTVLPTTPRGRPRGPYEELPIHTFQGRSRAVVKVQDGCDEMCAFCIVPFTRGVSRSRQPQAVVEEVARLVAAGFREVVISGVHLGLYGRDLPQPTSLQELLERIEELPGRFRVRLSSLLPGYVSDELVEWWGRSRRLCPHIHLSLQSGDDEVLAAMGRPYTAAQVRELVAKLRAARPDLAVSADVIVGFPGESPQAFENTLRLVEALEVSRLHVFPYSPRPGTQAARRPDDVPAPEKKARLHQLLQLEQACARRYHRRLVGRVVEVLLEEGKGSCGPQGVDEHYVRVELSGPLPNLQPGQLVAARVVQAGTRRVQAVPLDEPSPAQAGATASGMVPGGGVA